MTLSGSRGGSQMNVAMKPKGMRNVMPQTVSAAPKKVGASVPGVGSKPKPFRDMKC